MVSEIQIAIQTFPNFFKKTHNLKFEKLYNILPQNGKIDSFASHFEAKYAFDVVRKFNLNKLHFLYMMAINSDLMTFSYFYGFVFHDMDLLSIKKIIRN